MIKISNKMSEMNTFLSTREIMNFPDPRIAINSLALKMNDFIFLVFSLEDAQKQKFLAPRKSKDFLGFQRNFP